MIPCSPAMMFWSIVGHASFHTAGPMGPSTIDRSNVLCLVPSCATDCEVYYAPPRPFVYPTGDGDRRGCANTGRAKTSVMLDSFPKTQFTMQARHTNEQHSTGAGQYPVPADTR